MADNNSEIVSEYYENYTDTQREVLTIEIRKTRNILFILAAIFLVSELLGLLVLNAVFFLAFVVILIVPAIMVGLGFLAIKEPLIAMIIASVIIIGLWIYSIAITGGAAAITGWLVKGAVIYFIISGFRHATEANKIKRELKL